MGWCVKSYSCQAHPTKIELHWSCRCIGVLKILDLPLAKIQFFSLSQKIIVQIEEVGMETWNHKEPSWCPNDSGSFPETWTSGSPPQHLP